MKKIIALIALSLSLPSAFADIPMPPHPNPHPSFGPISPTPESQEISFRGAEATELNSSITGKTYRGSALRIGYSTYKVYRSSSGLTQIVCEVWKSNFHHGNRPEDHCTITQSLDGQPLPRFKPRHIMG